MTPKPYSWEQAKKDIDGIEGVLSLIGKGVPNIRGRRRMGYPFKLTGKQRKKHLRGEGLIEEELLGKRTLIVNNDTVIQEVRFLTNAAGLGSRKKGNVVADLFGLDSKNSPVLGEVKVTDRNPWYAVVECAAQVVLARADRKNLAARLGKELETKTRCVGAWGRVIAPEGYWRKREAASAEKLLGALKRTTQIRICGVSYARPEQLRADPVRLKVICGAPPATKFRANLSLWNPVPIRIPTPGGALDRCRPG